MKAPAPPLFGDLRIHLHLGAHKTATTFLQATLKKNNPSLLKQGVFYVPLNLMRANGHKLTGSIVSLSKANRPASRIQELRSTITAIYDPKRLSGCHTVLVSDENLSVPLTAFLKGSAYEGLADRLKFIRQELGPNIHVFFSTRDYPDFLSSVYVETLRHHPYRSFSEFLAGLYEDLPHFWSQAYRNLTGLLGSENVTFWDFRETVNNPVEVLSMLSAGAVGIEVDPTPARLGLSQRAVEFMRDFNKLPGSPMPPDVISKVADRLYPPSKINEKFDPWTPREKSALHSHYLAEQSSIPYRTFPTSSR